MMLANAWPILLAWTGLWLFSLSHLSTGSSDERPEEMDTGAVPEQNDHTLSQVLEQWDGFHELAQDVS